MVDEKLPEDVVGLLRALRGAQAALSDEHRHSLWFRLRDGYCTACGCDDPDSRCKCRDDS